jgi:hypothetical protein
MHDRLVITTQRGYLAASGAASGWGTSLIHTMDIEGTRSRPGVMNPGRWWGGTSLGRNNLQGCISRLLRMGWERLNRVEGGDLRLTGPRRPMIQDGQLDADCVNEL